MSDKVFDTAVIGSGPAGLTAALYTTRGAASTLVVAGEKWGGQLMLTTLVENFPGFPDGVQGPFLMSLMRKQAEKFGALVVDRNAKKVNFAVMPFEIDTGDGKIYKAKSLIISTGALTRWLGVPGEDKLVGRGVATCAPCDAPFYKGKKVAVVGGGDSAMEEALVLTKYASQVTIIHRRGEFRASAAMQKRVLENKSINVIWNTEVIKIIGDNKVEKLVLKDNKTGQQTELAVDGIFVAIGHKPDSDIFKGPIEMDDRGYIKITDSTKTSVPGVFTAGDVHDDKYKQAITAAGLGCQAAMDALKYLDKSTPSW